MLSASDLIRLPYTPDLTEGGIAYAIRSLPYTYNRVGGSPYDRLRHIVAGVAVELAFRRFLTDQNIPFDIKGATPFSDPDRYDVALGGHRCDIKSFLITYREQISEIRREPAVMLKAPALVPLDQYSADGHSNDDLYLFAFITGLMAASQEDLRKAFNAGQPHYLTHVMPDSWCKPKNWKPLAPLTLKSESEQPLLLEISGQIENRDFTTYAVKLAPNTRTLIEEKFFSISSIRVKSFPSTRLGIHSLHQKETHIVQPREWNNIWLYGMDVFLTGFINRAAFRQQAQLIQPGTRVFQYDQTRTKNLAVPISNLRPIHQLLERVKQWSDKSGA